MCAPVKASPLVSLFWCREGHDGGLICDLANGKQGSESRNMTSAGSGVVWYLYR